MRIVCQLHEVHGVNCYLTDWKGAAGVAKMSAAGAEAAKAAAGGGGADEKSDRPMGADGKPIPSVADIQKVRAAKKFEQQQTQVDEVIGMMQKNVENV